MSTCIRRPFRVEGNLLGGTRLFATVSIVCLKKDNVIYHLKGRGGVRKEGRKEEGTKHTGKVLGPQNRSGSDRIAPPSVQIFPKPRISITRP